MSSPIRRRRRVLPNRPGEVGSREWAAAIASATVGSPRYLLGLDGALYWSPVPDEHEDDGGPCGAAMYASPMAAVVAVTRNAGMIRLPDGWEIADEDGGDAPGDGCSARENAVVAEPASDPAPAVLS